MTSNIGIPPREQKTSELIYDFQLMLRADGQIDIAATNRYHEAIKAELDIRFADIDKKRWGVDTNPKKGR